MNINIRSIADISQRERDEMRVTLAWLLKVADVECRAEDWCVLFENSAVTLSFLVQCEALPLAVADESE